VRWRTPEEAPVDERTTHHAIHRCVDRLLRARDPKAGGAKMSKSTRRELLRWGAATAGAAALVGGAMGAPTRARLFAQTGQATPEAKATPTTLMSPHSLTETWTEPWIWRPSEWPGQRLDLNVTENENPGAIVGFGNQTAVLFSYGGGTPGPTIRMRGDEVLLVTLRNMLEQNFGASPLGPYPDPASFELPPYLTTDQVNAKARQLGQIRTDVCLGEHTNGIHSIHDTNLHTHGLHVRPGRNPDGTEADNILLRLISRQDFLAREAQADSPSCQWLHDPEQTGFLHDDETVGFVDFAFHVGDVQANTRARLGQAPQPHPPGTFWYHPHCHGSTHMQVSSGMAGFLIIEGDVDEAINLALTGSRNPDPQMKTGPYDYIERTMLIQRVFNVSQDPDARRQTLEDTELVPGAHVQAHSAGNTPYPAVNGDPNPAAITMRPGAIERWRVLNGSVDGQGQIGFIVLKGTYALEQRQSFDDPAAATVFGQEPAPTLVKLRDAATNTFTPATRAELEADKQQLYLLALDGITLVDVDGDEPVYAIRDLAAQNADTENPLDRELTGDNPNQAMLANIEACFKDATSIKNAFVRPNELLFAQGNRADILFQAPRLGTTGSQTATSETYTVLAPLSVLNSDLYQSALTHFGFEEYHRDSLVAKAGGDTVVAYVVVTEGTHADGTTPASIPEFNILDLNKVLPPVADYHRPITDEDVRVKAGAGDTLADPDAALPERVGKYRTRTIAYSGWGRGLFPLITTAGDSETAKNFRAFVERDLANGGKLESLRYAEIDNSGEYLLLPPNIETMAISNSLSRDVIDDSDPLFPITAGMARKFTPDDPRRPQMLLDTAEEWAVYNYSIGLWADTAEQPAGQYGLHYASQPLLRGEGQAKFAAQPENGKTWLLTSESVDHPFHMHTNPVWVMRVEIPDEQGNLVNILDKPEWRDVAWLPRNGGRVVFRSRFPDYVGSFVNHCHILLHEDLGMMQVVEVTPFADHANYELRESVASSANTPDAVTAIYPRLNQSEAYVQSLCFVDPNHMTGQMYPGFMPGQPAAGQGGE
jgi:FtsP/CotA-like multicopper oxidase with cupredoxin domain